MTTTHLDPILDLGADIDGQLPPADPPETVKQARLDGGVDDTFRTEAEFNGYRATQAGLDMTAGTIAQPAIGATGPLL